LLQLRLSAIPSRSGIPVYLKTCKASNEKLKYLFWKIIFNAAQYNEATIIFFVFIMKNLKRLIKYAFTASKAWYKCPGDFCRVMLIVLNRIVGQQEYKAVNKFMLQSSRRCGANHFLFFIAIATHRSK
jgi:hypothetical protein